MEFQTASILDVCVLFYFCVETVAKLQMVLNDMARCLCESQFNDLCGALYEIQPIPLFVES